MLDVARQQACIRVVCKYISESIKYGDQCTSSYSTPCILYYT